MSGISVSERLWFLKPYGRAHQGRDIYYGPSQKLRLQRGFKALMAQTQGWGSRDRTVEASNV